jgi:hypothetical protein
MQRQRVLAAGASAGSSSIPALVFDDCSGEDGSVCALIDEQLHTSWSDTNLSPILFDLGSSQQVYGYRWCTSAEEGSAALDPVAWVVELSNDGERWVVGHSASEDFEQSQANGAQCDDKEGGICSALDTNPALCARLECLGCNFCAGSEWREGPEWTMGLDWPTGPASAAEGLSPRAAERLQNWHDDEGDHFYTVPMQRSSCTPLFKLDSRASFRVDVQWSPAADVDFGIAVFFLPRGPGASVYQTSESGAGGYCMLGRGTTPSCAGVSLLPEQPMLTTAHPGADGQLTEVAVSGNRTLSVLGHRVGLGTMYHVFAQNLGSISGDASFADEGEASGRRLDSEEPASSTDVSNPRIWSPSSVATCDVSEGELLDISGFLNSETTMELQTAIALSNLRGSAALQVDEDGAGADGVSETERHLEEEINYNAFELGSYADFDPDQKRWAEACTVACMTRAGGDSTGTEGGCCRLNFGFSPSRCHWSPASYSPTTTVEDSSIEHHHNSDYLNHHWAISLAFIKDDDSSTLPYGFGAGNTEYSGLSATLSWGGEPLADATINLATDLPPASGSYEQPMLAGLPRSMFSEWAAASEYVRLFAVETIHRQTVQELYGDDDYYGNGDDDGGGGGSDGGHQANETGTAQVNTSSAMSLRYFTVPRYFDYFGALQAGMSAGVPSSWTGGAHEDAVCEASGANSGSFYCTCLEWQYIDLDTGAVLVDYPLTGFTHTSSTTSTNEGTGARIGRNCLDSAYFMCPQRLASLQRCNAGSRCEQLSWDNAFTGERAVAVCLSDDVDLETALAALGADEGAAADTFDTAALTSRGEGLAFVEDANGGRSYCHDTCMHASDGVCDDGGAVPAAAMGMAPPLCNWGTDCADCGVRSTPEWSPVLCMYAPHLCDADYYYGNAGTGSSYGIDESPPTAAPTTVSTIAATDWQTDKLCTDTCPYDLDGDCDDSGTDSLFSLCDYGTDCSDCGVRYASDALSAIEATREDESGAYYNNNDDDQEESTGAYYGNTDGTTTEVLSVTAGVNGMVGGADMVPLTFNEQLWSETEAGQGLLQALAQQQASCGCAQQGQDEQQLLGGAYYDGGSGEDCTCAIDAGMISYAAVLEQAILSEGQTYPVINPDLITVDDGLISALELTGGLFEAGGESGEQEQPALDGTDGGDVYYYGEHCENCVYYYDEEGWEESGYYDDSSTQFDNAMAAVPDVMMSGCLAGVTDDSMCFDERTVDGQCSVWAENKECDSNPTYMFSYCRKSCGVCSTEDAGGKAEVDKCPVAVNWGNSVQAAVGTAESDSVMAGVCEEMHTVLAAGHHADGLYDAWFGNFDYYYYDYYSSSSTGGYYRRLQEGAYYTSTGAESGAYYTATQSQGQGAYYDNAGGGAGGGGAISSMLNGNYYNSDSQLSPAGELRYGSPGAGDQLAWSAGEALPADAACFSMDRVDTCTYAERTTFFSLMYVCTCVNSYIGDGYCDHEQNHEFCQYDGGDCCEASCPAGTYSDDGFECGASNGYGCRDPKYLGSI